MPSAWRRRRPRRGRRASAGSGDRRRGRRRSLDASVAAWNQGAAKTAEAEAAIEAHDQDRRHQDPEGAEDLEQDGEQGDPEHGLRQPGRWAAPAR